MIYVEQFFQDFPEYSWYTYTWVDIGTNVMFSLTDDHLDPVGSHQ